MVEPRIARKSHFKIRMEHIRDTHIVSNDHLQMQLNQVTYDQAPAICMMWLCSLQNKLLFVAWEQTRKADQHNSKMPTLQILQNWSKVTTIIKYVTYGLYKVIFSPSIKSLHSLNILWIWLKKMYMKRWPNLFFSPYDCNFILFYFFIIQLRIQWILILYLKFWNK